MAAAQSQDEPRSVPPEPMIFPQSKSPRPRRGPLPTRLLLLICALALGGCASWAPTTPDPSDLKPDLPANWSTQAAAPAGAAVGTSPLAQWWQRFNDPLLESLITRALQANTSVRSAQAALKQARALRDVKSADLLPGVSASGSAQRNQSGDGEGNSSFRVGLDASWEPDIFGGRRNALNASEADAQVAEATLADVRVSMAAEVALAYIELRGQQAQLQIARDNLASQQETLQLTDWRAQAGLITSLEVAQARAASEQTSAQLPVLQAGISRSGHSLALLTGQPAQVLLARLATAHAVPRAPDELVLDIPAQTLRQRADVRAAEQRVSAALARLSVAQAARYPSFSLSGSLGLSALSLGALTNGASLLGTLLGRVSVPLFDAGATQAQVRAQDAALEQARAAYEGVVLTALKEVEDALVALQGERARQRHLQNAASAAADAALLAQHRYSGGLIDFQIVLQTQRSLLSAQDSVAASRASLAANHVRLYKALGGGWN